MITEPTKYIKSYTNFRGIDFSSDQVVVSPNRFAFGINVYKDYKSSQGQAIETFTGFGKSIVLPTADKVYKVFPYKYNSKEVFLVHAGKNLYVWDNYPFTANIVKQNTTKILAEEAGILQLSFDLDTVGVEIDKIELVTGGETFVLNENVVIGEETETFATLATVDGVTTVIMEAECIWEEAEDNHTLQEGDQILVYYYESKIEMPIYSDMNEGKSSFIVYNNICYINDGKSYLKVYYDSVLKCEKVAVTDYPKTYINRQPHIDESKASSGTEVAQANKLTPYFSNTFISPTPKYITLKSTITSVNGNTLAQTLIADPLDELKHKIRLTPNVVGTAETFDTIEFKSTLFGINNGEAVSQVLYIEVVSGETNTTYTTKVYEAFLSDELISKYFIVTEGTGYIEVEAKDFYNIATVYKLSETEVESVSVKVYGTVIDTGYSYSNGKVTFTLGGSWNDGTLTITGVPTAPEYNGEEIGFAGIEITGKRNTQATDIDKCNISCVYDNRVFFTGNASNPTTVYYSMLDNPEYIGEYNYFVDGKGQEHITGIMPVGDTLTILKEDSPNSVYYHTPIDTGSEVVPRTYTTKEGLITLGCIGGYTNFLDDPVYVSRLGIEAIGQLSERLERALEHRSSMIDGQFVNEEAGLATCILEEWNGYLVALIGGKMYLADSRQTYQDELGNMQYEWYYIDGVGVYDGQFRAYDYLDKIPELWKHPISGYEYDETTNSIVYQGNTLQLIDSISLDINGSIANLRNEEIHTTEVLKTVIDGNEYDFTISYISQTDGDNIFNYIVSARQDFIGGTYFPATTITPHKDNLIFGTGNGVVCSFYFNKREDGIIPNKYYNFDGRIILSGVATAFDNCGSPHLLKTTAKRSMVLKIKSLSKTRIKIKIRTDKSDYRVIGAVTNGYFNFTDMDFEDFTFNTMPQNTFVVNERFKKWIEKQVFIYSDTYLEPFSLYHIIYSYYLIGKVK